MKKKGYLLREVPKVKRSDIKEAITQLRSDKQRALVTFHFGRRVKSVKGTAAAMKTKPDMVRTAIAKLVRILQKKKK